MATTLFTDGRVRTLVGANVDDWLLLEDGRVVGTGSKDDIPHADLIVDLGGAVIVPGFCDAHVHLPATGLYARGLDFRGETSKRAIVDAFAERAKTGDETEVLFGGNFEDPLDEPLTRHDLDAVVEGRPAMLARADMHSCIVSTALLERLDVRGLEGVDVDDDASPTGYLREKAASEAWSWFDAHLSPEQQKAAVHAAVEVAYSKGVTSVHEMFVVEWRGWPSFEIFRAAVDEVALDVTTYLGTNEVTRVKALGFTHIGGDFFLDGAFGSHTAWLGEPYATEPPPGSPPNGISYRTDEELFEFFYTAQLHELQVGVHAIGDAAIEQAIATWEKVSTRLGIVNVRKLGHRIEHFECASDDHIRRAANLDLRASVQPAFDRYWGGPDGLYARRMGWERASDMNRFRTMGEQGVRVGAGSDSTVTPLDPFLQMASLREHHLEAERMPALEALWAHTAGAHHLKDDYHRGVLEAGNHADLAVLDRDPVEVSGQELLDAQVLSTWIGGEQVWSV